MMSGQIEGEVNCWIYGSSRQQEMYLYLSERDNFDALPKVLMQHFGTPRLVMELTLNTHKKLAREDVYTVIDNLQVKGYHLQMPPKIDATINDGE